MLNETAAAAAMRQTDRQQWSCVVMLPLPLQLLLQVCPCVCFIQFNTIPLVHLLLQGPRLFRAILFTVCNHTSHIQQGANLVGCRQDFRLDSSGVQLVMLVWHVITLSGCLCLPVGLSLCNGRLKARTTFT